MHSIRLLFLGPVSALFMASPIAAQEAPARTSDACDRDVLAARLLERDPELTQPLAARTATWDPLTIRCVRVNGDDLRDALWTLSFGGSGGAMLGGVTVSGSGDVPATIAAWEGDHSRQITGFRKGRPAIASPRYRKGDANCCASGGWRWRTYTAGPKGSVKRGKQQTTPSAELPLKEPK